MLKASDRVANDIVHAFEGCRGGEGEAVRAKADCKQILTLKKWYDFDRRRELRCFVVRGRLAGRSHRSCLLQMEINLLGL